MADPVTMIATGLAVASTATSTVGAMAGDAQDKYAAESRARIAGIQSDQTQTTALSDLSRQIGNIKAIRASSNVGAGSPTTQALIDAERNVSEQNLAKKKASFKLDELQAKADSKLYSQKAMLTLGGGVLKAGTSIASGLP